MTATRGSKWFGIALVLIAGQLAWSTVCLAAADQETIKIEPYKGPPIFLPETGQVVQRKIVTRETLKEQYEDKKTIRVEREVARYSDDSFAADGKYKEYHPNSKPFIEGQFKEGRQEGEWTYYFDNGQVNRKAIYKDGKPDGSWETFRADGTLQAKRSFKDGLRDGEWITYDDTGKIPLIEEHYAKGEEDGTWKIYFPNGKIRQQVGFKDGKRQGTSAEWNEKGEKLVEANYADGKVDGAATRYLPDGKKIVQTFKDGKFVSETKE
jgi:antitoxin component YwqK of YwqJK toxin-antitoxin module